MIDYDESGVLVVQVAEGFLLSEPIRPYEGDSSLYFLVQARGRWGSVGTSVETWNGDGLDTFLASLAETSVAGEERALGTRSATT
ncbi:hypothetical protein ACFQV4_30060 [Streptomyces thermocarboxydus]